MGLFSKPKPNPKIIVEGVEVEFDTKHEIWSFVHGGAEFVAHGDTLNLPTKAELEAILATVVALKSEIRSRLQKGLADWPNVKIDDGESYLIDVTDFALLRSFMLSWSG